MSDIVVHVTDDEMKALGYDIVDAQEWADNLVRNKVRQCADKIIEEYSDKQARKIKYIDKLDIIRKTKFKSAKDRLNEVISDGKNSGYNSLSNKTN